MRDFFSSTFFKAVLATLIISFGAFVYNLTSNSTLLSTNATGSVLNPIQEKFSDVGTFFSNAFSKSFEFDEIKQQNNMLLAQVYELQALLRESEYALIENELLREYADIEAITYKMDFEIAEVVGESFTNTQNILTIDKGRNASVEVSDLVITNAGVVGYICEVGETYSKIRTLLDPDFTIGCIVSRTRDLGILENELKYTSQGLLKVGYLDKNLDIQSGDTIEISGVSGLYPKGFLVGTVESVNVESQGVSKYATLTPSVDFDSLNQVFIIKGF